MEIIGKVKIKWNDAPVVAPVTADGYIQMPDGTMRRLREETFQEIKEKLLTTAPTPQAESEEAAEPDEAPLATSAPTSEAPVTSVQYNAEWLDKMGEPAVLGEPELKDSSSTQETEETASRTDRKKECQERKALKKQKKKKEKANAQKEESELTAKALVSPGKAAAIAVAAVLLAEAVLVAGYQMTQKNGVSLHGPEVTASVSGVGDIPDDAESVLIIARVKGDDGVERDIALGKFSPSV